MKNRCIIKENSCKIELGGVLGPLGAFWVALLASLSVLGASWERLESVLERLGCVPVASRSPKGTPHGLQEEAKIGQKSIQNRIDFWINFRCDFAAKMNTERPPKPCKSGPKKCSMFRSFFHRFLDRSWGPKSLKMSTSCTREAHFHKIAFADSGIFLEAKIMKKGSQNGSQMA